jgi:hypothetical protein
MILTTLFSAIGVRHTATCFDGKGSSIQKQITTGLNSIFRMVTSCFMIPTNAPAMTIEQVERIRDALGLGALKEKREG